MSDADASALAGYLRSQPATGNGMAETQLNLIGMIVFGSGMFGPTMAQEPITAPVIAPPEDTVEYGGYLVNFSGCTECHGPDLTGGDGAPNIVASTSAWTEDDFVKAMQTGETPSGRQLSEEMPWKEYALAFDETDLRWMYAYIHQLEVAQK
jgi:cytochrome c553